MKKIKKPIIVLIIILIVGIVTFLCLYFATDIFKSSNSEETSEETNEDTIQERAERALDETYEAQAREAVSIAKQDIIEKNYLGDTPITDEQTIMSMVKNYLTNDWKVEVTKSNDNLYYINFVTPKNKKIKNIELIIPEMSLED